jgi:hypothetical protein
MGGEPSAFCSVIGMVYSMHRALSVALGAIRGEENEGMITATLDERRCGCPQRE